MLRMGVTGATGGCTPWQAAQLRSLLMSFTPSEVHHGDCIGVDALSHAIAIELRDCSTTGSPRVHIHPPEDSKQRAFCQYYDVMHPLQPYLVRDREIAACDLLVAVPHSRQEQLRSGTWATVRYARGLKYPLIIRINPDETVEFG
jgi:hypothetical protein